MASKSGNPDVVVVGSSNTDMVVAAKRLPRPGETVLGGSFYRAAGGKGANQAVAAARAGAHTAFVGCFGDDDLGREARENLAGEGIDLKHASSLEGVPSGVALILVDEKGDNLISVAPGANARLTLRLIDDAREMIEGAKVLLMQLEVPPAAVERAAEYAAGRHVPILLNPAPAPSSPLSPSLLEKITLLIANEEEMASMAASLGSETGDLDGAAAVLRGSGVHNSIVTLGPRGGRVYIKDGGSWSYEGTRVEAVDTVAAGDCFCGWMAACLSQGRLMEDAVDLAARAAAISVTRRGAQPSLPKRDEVLS